MHIKKLHVHSRKMKGKTTLTLYIGIYLSVIGLIEIISSVHMVGPLRPLF